MIGDHDGLMYYTLGQRQGLGIGGRADSNDAPWYVAGKDLDRNVLIAVQGTEHPLLYSRELTSAPVMWVALQPPALPARLTAKTRYRQPDQACTVSDAGEGRVHVVFDEPQRAVTPGQSVVFYDGPVCLGGAPIEATR